MTSDGVDAKTETFEPWNTKPCCDLSNQIGDSTWFGVQSGSTPKIQWVIENTTDLTEIEFVENVPIFSIYQHDASTDEMEKKERKFQLEPCKLPTEIKRNEKRRSTGAEKLAKKVATSRFGRTRKVIDFSKYDA